MRRSSDKMVFGTIALFVTIVAVGFVYAGFTGTLRINGTGSVTASKWDIYFANLSNAVTTGEANEIEAPTIKTKTSIGDYLVEFNELGDSITYTFDVVNDGSFDALLTVLSITPPQCSGGDATSNEVACNNLEYTLKYTSTGEPVRESDTLLKGETRNMTLKLAVKSNGNLNGVTRDVTIGGLGIQMMYSQASGYNGANTIVNDIAMFLPGSDFNIKIKQLANPTETVSDETFIDTNIIGIQRYTSTPSDTILNNAEILSTNDSYYPIYAWFDNGIIYYFTVYKKPYFNSDSSRMFFNLTQVNRVEIDTLNSSVVSSVQYMFYKCKKLSAIDLSNFTINNLTSLSSMFENSGFTELDLSSFNTKNVRLMSFMFAYSEKLETINFGDDFDTKNVTSMWSMFNSCNSLKELDLSNFNTSNVTDIKRMFMNCINIKELDLSSFDLLKTNDITEMIAGMTSLSQLKTPKFYPTDSSLTIILPTTMYDSNENAYTELNNTSPTNALLKRKEQ